MFGSDLDSAQLLQALYETLYMVSIALFLGAVIGIPLGVLLVITRKQGIWPNIVIHQVLNPLINILRSLPFIILLIAIVPFTKLVVGTSIGTTAAIVPLTVYVAPYIARLVENSLLEVDEGIIEAAKAMGASPLQIISISNYHCDYWTYWKYGDGRRCWRWWYRRLSFSVWLSKI